MASPTERRVSPLWHPQGLLGQVAKMEVEQVAAAFEGAYFLVVRLDEFSSGLGAGLKAADSNQMRAWVDTGSVATPDLITKLTPPRASMMPEPIKAGNDALDYPSDLLEAECHVVRIRKRTWQSSSPAVSLGRAPEQDIPLQHASVSKLHALLEQDAGQLYVTDVGSLNRTFLNGEPIQGRTQVQPGDSIKFGAVRCAACTAVGLWRALQRQRGSVP